MSENAKYTERLQLVEDAIALKETPRVLNACRVNSFPFRVYGVSIRTAMTDYQAAIDAYIRYHREFQPDVASGFAAQESARVLELMGVKCMRWPGHGLSDDSLPQFIEYPTLEEDEYEEFFSDPAGFAYRKWLPKMCDVFEPFASIDYMEMMTGIYRAPINAFTSPKLLDSYRRILAAAEEWQSFLAYSKKCGDTLKADGFPSIVGSTSGTAFDLLADGLRGTFGIMTDIMEQPEQIKRCCEKFVQYHINKSVGAYKRSGNKYQWVMLHKGFDNFIGDDTYGELYWPYLKQWIMALIEQGITPMVFCEGAYTTRLKYLADVPKGKVVYRFEQVDIREAKRVLGGTACISGGYPMQLLMQGKPPEIIDKAKEFIDVLAPGGGFMFDLSTSIDAVPRENLEALFDTIYTYGKK